MAWPFSPLVTFLSRSVPKVTAAFLNSIQASINALAKPSYYSRPQTLFTSADGAAGIVNFSPMMIKDAATGEYSWVDNGGSGTIISTAMLVPAAGAWPINSQLYVYVVCTNGVLSYEISATAPVTGGYGPSPIYMSGDETRRYLVTFYVNGSGQIVPVTATSGHYIFNTNINVATVTNTSFASKPLIVVPPHARQVGLWASGDAARTLSVRISSAAVAPPADALCDGRSLPPITSSGSIEAKVDSTGSVSLGVTEFWE